MILIISSENDTMTDAICSWLSFLKKSFVRLNENQIVNKVYFDFEQGVFNFSINNNDYQLSDFKSIFYRNGSIIFDKYKGEVDANLDFFYNTEFKAVTDFISYYFKANGCKIYGNFYKREVNKLEVLFLAKSLGLKIPDTYVISYLEDFAKINISNKYITKSLSEMQPIFVDNQLYLNYTCELDLEQIKFKNQNLIPTLVQKKIDRNFEIRLFFFNKNIWAIATFEFSDDIDVRNIIENNKKYHPYELPHEIKTKINKMAKLLNLNCGTVDLIKSDENFYFLEVNPLGQFHQVSYYGNYNIEKYIADLL